MESSCILDESAYIVLSPESRVASNSKPSLGILSSISANNGKTSDTTKSLIHTILQGKQIMDLDVRHAFDLAPQSCSKCNQHISMTLERKLDALKKEFTEYSLALHKLSKDQGKSGNLNSSTASTNELESDEFELQSEIYDLGQDIDLMTQEIKQTTEDIAQKRRNLEKINVENRDLRYSLANKTNEVDMELQKAIAVNQEIRYLQQTNNFQLLGNDMDIKYNNNNMMIGGKTFGIFQEISRSIESTAALKTLSRYVVCTRNAISLPSTIPFGDGIDIMPIVLSSQAYLSVTRRVEGIEPSSLIVGLRSPLSVSNLCEDITEAAVMDRLALILLSYCLIITAFQIDPKQTRSIISQEYLDSCDYLASNADGIVTAIEEHNVLFILDLLINVLDHGKLEEVQQSDVILSELAKSAMFAFLKTCQTSTRKI